ncbi:hypothetical protein GGS20DRAFT_166769 [Poronia punctata]|nr:hypothetical protein GGS20DRAFT_166769 [Poronia punctata]
MASSQSTRPNAPPYPSYREVLSERIPITFNASMDRLFWPLEGAFPEAIFVMKHPKGSKEDPDPFYRSTITAGGDGNSDDGSSVSGPWHECASEPATDPKVSSIEVAARELDQWESDWVAWHGMHGDAQCAPDADQQFVAYGDLDDDVRPFRREGGEDGDWEEDSEKEFLVRCCGQDRPLGKKGPTLLVTPAPGHDLVTVRDFVDAVHPWLMGMRDDLAKAKTVARWEAFPESTRWMVNYHGLTSSSRGGEDNVLVEREKWIREHGPPRPAEEAWKSRFMAKIKETKEREKGIPE